MGTPLEKLYPHVLEADFIHIMSIDEIGKQGYEFDSKVLDKIKSLKGKFPDTIISLDGGVTLENIESIKDAGVDRIIIGSAIFGANDPEEALLDFLDVNYT